MLQRFYLDTSVFGGYFDEEFEEHTIPLFNKFRNGEFVLLFSAVTADELANAPEKVKELVKNLEINQSEFLEVTDEAVELANQYIREKVVGETSYADCLHIAIATINQADFLVSWNFKHVVNVQRISNYNAVNRKFGYKQLDIRSPREFLNDEND